MTAATTIGDVVGRVNRKVNGSLRQPFNKLAVAMDASQTTVQLAQAALGVSQGSYLGIDDEIVYVYDFSAGTLTASIERGVNGTTPATHDIGTFVEVDWRWFSVDVLDELGNEIRSWPEDLFVVRTTDVAVGNVGSTFDVALTGFRHVLAIHRSRTGSDRWADVTANHSVTTGLPTSSYPSGNALIAPLSNWGVGTVRVTYAADFTTATIERATPLATIGLSPSLTDALEYGAAYRLLAPREAQRSSVESQPEPRQSSEVAAGVTLRAAAGFKQLRDERIAEEVTRLRGLYPIRFT